MGNDRVLPSAKASGPWVRHLAWLPVPLIAIAAAVLYRLNISASYESTLLQTTLSTLFRTSISLLIAYLAARTYLVAGSRAVLALGCGALAFGLASLLAGLLMTDRNTSVTVHNLGVCLAGACFLLSAGWAVRGKPGRSVAPAPLAAVLAYLAVLVALGLITWSSEAGAIPAFLGEQDFTALRQAILGLTVIEFALASLCLVILYSRSRTPFLKWYGAGLALISTGVLVIIIEGSLGTPLSWVGRSGQYLGGLYMLIGIMTAAEGPWGWKISLEQALYESEDRYQALVETSPEAIIVHRNGRFLYANPAALQLYGADTFEQLSARNAFELVPPELRAQASSRMQQTVAGMVLPRWDGQVLRLDGHPVFVETSAAAISFQGAPAIQAIIRDVTGRKQAQEERERLLKAEQRARSEAEAALRLRDEFLSVAAHEIKTPITNLRGYSQLLMRRIDKGTIADVSRVCPSLQVIDREADKLSGLVSRLLDISRLQGDGLLLDRQVTDLADLAREVVESMQLAAGQQTLRLQASPSLIAFADPLRLQQILINLIDNAVKFGPEGAAVEIELASPDPDTVRLSVRDHGPGIPPAERERLFSRYHRAGTRRPAGGLGLGLYISRQIVELHGGRIEAEFPPDGGTCFIVTLPRNLDEVSTDPAKDTS